MVKNYYISEEGKKAFAEIGLEYPTEILEREFEEWYTKKTSNSSSAKLPDGERDKYIQSMTRLRVPNYSSSDKITYEEYIIHDMHISRMTKIGNFDQRYQSPLGVYPKPRPRYTVVQTADFDRIKKLDGFDSVTPVYTIPFTKENADKLFKKYCDRKTQLIIRDGDHLSGTRKYSIKTFEEWRDGTFEDLFFWGHIPSKEEIKYKNQEEKQRKKVQTKIEADRLRAAQNADPRQMVSTPS